MNAYSSEIVHLIRSCPLGIAGGLDRNLIQNASLEKKPASGRVDKMPCFYTSTLKDARDDSAWKIHRGIPQQSKPGQLFNCYTPVWNRP